MGNNIKKWHITCQVNMCAEKKVSIIVAANTELKAKIYAKDKLEKQGYSYIKIISCDKIEPEV